MLSNYSPWMLWHKLRCLLQPKYTPVGKILLDKIQTAPLFPRPQNMVLYFQPVYLPPAKSLHLLITPGWSRLAERAVLTTRVKSSSRQGWLDSSFCSEMRPCVLDIWLPVRVNGSPLWPLVASVYHLKLRFPTDPESQPRKWSRKLHQASSKAQSHLWWV